MLSTERTYHQITDDHDHHEDAEAHAFTCHLHAVPHGLDPLPTQDAEDDEEGVEEVMHVPARQHAVLGNLAHTFTVVLAEQLHAHHSEDEDDDAKDESQVAQSAHRVADDAEQHVEGGPGLCQFEDAHLPPHPNIYH